MVKKTERLRDLVRDTRNVSAKTWYLEVLETFLCKVDLKNGYFNMKIEDNARPYLGFQYRGVFYRYAALPMGVTNGVFYFRLFSSSIKKLPRWMRQFVTVYLDDFIIGHSSAEVCQQIVNELINILMKYDIMINYKKSVLTPATTMEVLGFTVSKGKIVLSIKRREKLINSLRGAVAAQGMMKRGRQRILGLIEAAQLAINQIYLTKERALLNEVIQTIPEGNCHNLRAIFQEEYDAF